MYHAIQMSTPTIGKKARCCPLTAAMEFLFLLFLPFRAEYN